jgi:glycosyltransferase involved in cell wall biosynthesis
MPAYNCEKYIEEALKSVINQTYRNLEIIVIDDCSTDKTLDVANLIAKSDHRITVLHNEENLKISKTLNRAIKDSHGKYLARIDADDVRILDGIEKQVEFMEKSPGVIVVGGNTEICDVDMRTLNVRKYNTTDESIRRKLFRYSPYTHGSILMRSSMLPEDPYELDWAEDYDLYFRLATIGKLACLEDVVYRLRVHPNSISRSKTIYQEKLTLYIRMKAVFEYGYKMTLSDRLYFIAQLATMYLMPSSFRFWLFNKIRSIVR